MGASARRPAEDLSVASSLCLHRTAWALAWPPSSFRHLGGTGRGPSSQRLEYKALVRLSARLGCIGTRGAPSGQARGGEPRVMKCPQVSSRLIWPRAGRRGRALNPVLTTCVPAPRQSCDLALLAADETAHHGKPHSEPRLLVPGGPVSSHLLPYL